MVPAALASLAACAALLPRPAGAARHEDVYDALLDVGSRADEEARRALQALSSAGPRCCCQVYEEKRRRPLVVRGGAVVRWSTELGKMLLCKMTPKSQLESGLWSSHCPLSKGFHKASNYFSESALSAGKCPSGPFPLGPPATACTKSMSSCGACSGTIDASVPSNGLVKGRVLEGGMESEGPRVAGFFGVAYAEFRGRWELPGTLVPVAAQRASVAGDHCERAYLHQLRPELHKKAFCYQWVPALGYVGSDACLNLDVYTPAVLTVEASKGGGGASDFRLRETAGLPVMVFIFGGGFVMGDKYQNGIYDGRHLAQSQGVIVVSVNYRLGPMGFLHHPELQPNTNFGLQDQLQALRWVHENIRAFGGDPDRVTLFGESAGAMSICAHLASPTSRRLFSNVIMESGNCDGFFTFQPHRYALDHGTHYLRAVFGRIRGCARQNEAKASMEKYKEREEHCSEETTAPLDHVLSKCRDVFLHPDQSADVGALEGVLPFEHVNGCDASYAGCHSELPSGWKLDAALLQCARRLEAKYIWVNQFGLTQRIVRSDSNWIRRMAGLEFTGLPLPPHLWWSPVIDPWAGDSLDFAVGGGLMPLPMNVFTNTAQRPEGPRMITAGFNRDEGSLFLYILPSFFPHIDFGSPLSAADYKGIIRSVACADWSPSGQAPGAGVCERRVESMVSAYQDEGAASVARGACCTSDPNLLRVQRMLMDYLFVCPQLRTLSALSADTVPVRAYEFRVFDELPPIMPDMRDMLGAFHFSELFFVFGDSHNPGGNLPMGGGAMGFGLGWTSKDVKVSEEISNKWGAIGRNEAPPGWPSLSVTAEGLLSGSAVVFESASSSQTDVAHLRSVVHHCDLQDQLQAEVLNDMLPPQEK